jgi:hypothetical protein
MKQLIASEMAEILVTGVIVKMNSLTFQKFALLVVTMFCSPNNDMIQFEIFRQSITFLFN